MEEKILQTKKNGMTMLLLTLLGYVAAVVVAMLDTVILHMDTVVAMDIVPLLY